MTESRGKVSLQGQTASIVHQDTRVTESKEASQKRAGMPCLTKQCVGNGLDEPGMGTWKGGGAARGRRNGRAIVLPGV